MERKEKIIVQLREYFLKRPDIVMAFVFGSYAKGQETSESDFDVAVYYRPEGKEIEWEEEKDYEKENELWNDVENIAGMETDLVILNRASSTVASSVIQEGIPIIIKDPSFCLRFLLMISAASDEFMEFAQDFRAIKERSMSLTEVDKHRLIRTADFLETELSDYPVFAGINQKIYETDSAYRRNVERWTENIVNASIDIAKVLLASEKKRMPQTYREVLQKLSHFGNFRAETARKLAHFARLRNILAHEYLDIRFNQIRTFVKDSEPLYRELLELVKSFVD